MRYRLRTLLILLAVLPPLLAVAWPYIARAPIAILASVGAGLIAVVLGVLMALISPIVDRIAVFLFDRHR